MRIAVQGCSHGSLTAIYDTVAQYTARTSNPVELLLLCGDFQALRSTHDFASLAVPQKYHALGTFHQYYSGQRKAPLLTIVIGGNHEASNYMWELYHGGWLAENIYYLGAAGSVYVDGLRIAGASGIYKDHDYNKGHFEKVPYDRSTLRSVYHIRSYDVAKLMQLSPTQDTVFLSHDWPISIARHGDTGALLRRKPFFRDEVNKNTLGSPPLFNLLNHVQPAYWFSAHLHVKFAAIYQHSSPASDGPTTSNAFASSSSSSTSAANRQVAQMGNPDEIAIEDDDDFDDAAVAHQLANPDEINIDDDEFDDEHDHHDHHPQESVAGQSTSTTKGPADNPEEIAISDDEFDQPQPVPQAAASSDQISDNTQGIPEPTKTQAVEELAIDESVDLVEKAREQGGGEKQAEEVIAAPQETVDEAIREAQIDTAHHATGSGSQGRRTRFLALDKCGPGKEFIQFLEIPAPRPSPAGQAPRLTFDTEWLAITRALHPYLSTQIYQPPLPPPQVLGQLVADEKQRIADEGLLVPSLEEEVVGEDGQGKVELVWEKGEIDVGRVQRFWPTAPPEGQPGGSPSVFYTNPQTEAFCGMLGIENKVNPAPAPPPSI
ncbi:hypothetical protein I316_07696 [Kwoniella heveanensis BCC8398]|uniref:Lariat debranching enzyme C-terminal domain-containing protein n=1 Tax=Kwoniella heveanensis BCC8398 TaxID=1296120 RepID=A0A1B9GI05_9TREE|nr:hypothetical protein I316_07696 [Kwoniella heveanensis BCC8398]